MKIFQEALRRWRWAAYLALIVLVWLVFGQTVGHDFINCDDDVFVYQNPLVLQGISPDSVCRVVTSKTDTFYYPLTILSFMADAQLHGMNPAGFHLTNVLLHTASALLLFSFLFRLTGMKGRSFLVAALFSIHPLQVEAVAWVTGRKDMLSGLFFMLTMHAYLSYARKPFSWVRYLPVCFLFLLGLMAKPMLVTLPAVLLLLDYWPLGRLGRPRGRVILEKVPFLFLSVIFSLLSIFATSSIKDGTPVVQPPLVWRVGNALISCAAYLRQAVFPAGLGMPYPKYELSGGMLLASAAVLLIISCGVIYLRKKNPVLLLGWLWYLGMLLPVSGVIRFLGVARADRFFYLPGIGLFILIIWAVTWPHSLKKYAKIGTCGVFAILVVSAHFQVRYWKNNLTLWTRAIEVTGPSAIAYVNLGVAFCEANEPYPAEACFQRALQLDPDDQEALYNLGLLRVLSNRILEGESYLKRVLMLNPNRVDANKTLGAVYISQGEAQRGMEYTLKALAVCPNDASTRKNLQAAQQALDEKRGRY